jgi:hypothetical protein
MLWDLSFLSPRVAPWSVMCGTVTRRRRVDLADAIDELYCDFEFIKSFYCARRDEYHA